MKNTPGQKTYIGATVDVDRRLRQHNKELAGGAHATGAQVDKGAHWRRICYVRGFPTWRTALQFEWRWKQISRRISPAKPAIERRLDALQELLSLDKATTAAIPYDEWPNPPEVIME